MDTYNRYVYLCVRLRFLSGNKILWTVKNTKFEKGNYTREVFCLNPGTFAQMLPNKAIVICNIVRGRDKSRMVIVRKG